MKRLVCEKTSTTLCACSLVFTEIITIVCSVLLGFWWWTRINGCISTAPSGRTRSTRQWTGRWSMSTRLANEESRSNASSVTRPVLRSPVSSNAALTFIISVVLNRTESSSSRTRSAPILSFIIQIIHDLSKSRIIEALCSCPTVCFNGVSKA